MSRPRPHSVVTASTDPLAPAFPPMKVHCRAICTPLQDGGHEVAYEVFDAAGSPLGRMAGLTLRMRPGPAKASVMPVPPPISPSRVAADLEELLPELPHGLAFLNHDELDQPESILELTRTEIDRIEVKVGKRHLKRSLARLVATRRAAAAFAHRHGIPGLIANHLSMVDPEHGQPALRFEDAALECHFSGLTLSLAGCQEYSVAMIARAPVGIDWQVIAGRQPDDWRAQLGEAGHPLAEAMSTRTGESFDCSATRVATLLGAGRNGLAPEGLVPSFGERLGESYLSFHAESDGQAFSLISVTLQPHRPGDRETALTILHRKPAH